MNSSQLDPNGKHEGFSSEQLFPPDSPDISDTFAYPQVPPRVGSAYQVEIPPMLTESERLQLLKNPVDTETDLDVSHNFLMGLPIPLVWVDHEGNTQENGRVGAIRGSNDLVSGFKRAKRREVISNKGGLKSKPLDIASDNDKTGKSASKSCCLVPGVLGDSSWTDVQACSFLLAIYIFRKNFVQVKRFVESKDMGDILSFYYGKFYGSDGRKRYSCRRKMIKAGKCKIGHTICTGGRQQELLSRLLPCVSEAAKSALVEVCDEFAKGRISLEDYILTLRIVVGIPALIEAVGIGRGKEDLTTPEPSRNNQLPCVRPEIPVGKAFSSLTSGDIIKFLTGDFRLSKARSSDIFWEAVWPRLLARGWHSEQPNNHLCYGSRNQLIFLMPHVKNFSRGKLVKGEHYFDSVSDILTKVASEPVLIELEDETEPVLDHNDFDDHQQHCYLKPRVSTCSSNPAMCTVVDTSLSCEVKSFEVRGLRILPDDTENTLGLNIQSKETEGDFPRNFSMDKTQSADILLKGHKKNKLYNQGRHVVEYNSQQRMPFNDSECAKKMVEDHQHQDTVLSNFEQLYNFNQRVRPGCSNLSLPLMKRSKLASCVNDDSSRSKEKLMVTNELKEVESNFLSNSSYVSEAVPFHEKVQLSSSSPQGSPTKESSGGIEKSPVNSVKPRPWPLIDLNEPPISLDSENSEFCMMEVNESLGNPNVHVLDKCELVEPELLSNSTDANVAAKMPVVNPRRQSTRSRPMTTRALEALAGGFLGTKEKRKGRESEVQRKRVSKRPSHRAHIRATLTSISGRTSTGIVHDKEGNGVDEVWNGNKNGVRDPLFGTEKKAAQELVETSKAAHHPGVQKFHNDLSGLTASAASGRVLSDQSFR